MADAWYCQVLRLWRWFGLIMLPNHEDSEQLQIRCPACGQRFKVGNDLLDRMVECGTCEHRFRIDDDAILRNKKFYPGERRNPRLDGFARVPHAPSVPPNLLAVQYGDEPAHESFEPPAPQRTMAAVAGCLGMLLAGLLLTLGAKRNGALDGFDTSSRLALAAFAGVLGGGMVIYGNPRGRKKAALLALLTCVVLITLPFLFRGGSVPLGSGVVMAKLPDSESEPVVLKDESTDLASVIGLQPLIKENALLASKDGSKAIGIWFRQLQFTNKLLVRDYMIRVTGADVSSSIYPREGEDWLMVLTGVSAPIEEIAILAGRIGHDEDSTHILTKLGVIEVVVDNNVFVEGPADKLQDKSNPAFYDLNRRELDSIDLERSRKAVKRLADAEPKLYRDDICRRLVQLLKEADAPMGGDLCRALGAWSDPGDDKAVAAAVKALRKLMNSGMVPPREMVEFLVVRKFKEVAPLLDKLWAADATVWELLYGDLGPVIEPLVLAQIKEASSTLRHSALRLLAKVGGKASLPVIAALRGGADTELRVLIERAETAIHGRVGQ
jgi:hypothetical protein